MSAARSGSWAIALLSLTVLSACDSTQQQAARARLKDARYLASSTPTIARGANASVRVAGVTVVRGSGGTAVAVRLVNRSSRPFNDLPISVGVLAGRRRAYLNAGPNTFYFETHLASIAGRAALTWVFTTPRKLRATGTPFASVGARPAMPLVGVRVLPRVVVAAVRSTRGLRVRVTNDSAVPQYQLQVYAIGLTGGRAVSAGRTTISHLGTGETDTLPLVLIGARSPVSLQLEALPTMFQ